jgi:hypothetical protein
MKILFNMKIGFDITNTAKRNNDWYALLIPTIICGSFSDAYEVGIGWLNFVAVIVVSKNEK